MAYRLVGHAADRIDAALLESGRRWGIEAAGRYHRLILAAADAVGRSPDFPGMREIARLPGVRYLHLRYARRLVGREDRVAAPPHLLVYRVAPDGVVEILSLLHDRMSLPEAARGAERAASP